MTRKRRRLTVVLLCGIGIGSAAALTLSAFSSDLTFFVLPSDLASRHPSDRQTLRLGGMVQAGSVQKLVEGREPETRFRVSDGRASVEVSYVGILPDLFREGQSVVTLGHLRPDGSFAASEVLAKHDETYMPPDVAAALKKKGLWRPQDGPPPPASTWDAMTVSPAGKAAGAQGG